MGLLRAASVQRATPANDADVRALIWRRNRFQQVLEVVTLGVKQYSHDTY